jgi:hypothetical protein
MQLKKSHRAKEAESNSKKKAAVLKKDLNDYMLDNSERQGLFLNQDNRRIETLRTILEFHARESPVAMTGVEETFSIKGVTGMNADIVNGMYRATEKHVNSKPVFVKDGDSKHSFYMSCNGHWTVAGSINVSDDYGGQGFAYLALREKGADRRKFRISFPAAQESWIGTWRVLLDESKWVDQPLVKTSANDWFFVFASDENMYTSSEEGQVVEKIEDGEKCSGAIAVGQGCLEMIKGQHFFAFEVVKTIDGGSWSFGVCRPGIDLNQDIDLNKDSKVYFGDQSDSWVATLPNWDLKCNSCQGKGCTDKSLTVQQGSHVGLLLDLDSGGTLTIYINNTPCGTVAEGLVGPLLPCVQSASKGIAIKIHGGLSMPSRIADTTVAKSTVVKNTRLLVSRFAHIPLQILQENLDAVHGAVSQESLAKGEEKTWLDGVKIALAKHTAEFDAGAEHRRQRLEKSVAEANAKTLATRKAFEGAVTTAAAVETGENTSVVADAAMKKELETIVAVALVGVKAKHEADVAARKKVHEKVMAAKLVKDEAEIANLRPVPLAPETHEVQPTGTELIKVNEAAAKAAFEAKCECPKGHLLVRFDTSTVSLSGFTCDSGLASCLCPPGSGKCFPEGTLLFGCRPCNFDLCCPCTEEKAAIDKAMSAGQERAAAAAAATAAVKAKAAAKKEVFKIAEERMKATMKQHTAENAVLVDTHAKKEAVETAKLSVLLEETKFSKGAEVEKELFAKKAAAEAASAAVVADAEGRSGAGITVSTVNAGTAVGATDRLVLKNKNIRFGNEEQPSFNAVTGLLEQPFYNNGGQWSKLTIGSNGLEDAMRFGGTGSGWNTEGWDNLPQMIGTPKILNSLFEERPKETKDAANGYKVGHGTLSSVTKYSCGSNITLTVTRMCTLGLMETSAEFTTHFEVSGGNLQNFRYWFGTRDDWIGNDDRPTKKIGYFDTKAEFTLASGGKQSTTNRREWLCISSGDESVYFGSMDDNVKVVQSGYGSLANNVMRVDPEIGTVKVQNDGSYAVFAGFGVISAGESRAIKAFYAVGTTKELTNVSRALAAKAEARKLELELEKHGGSNLLWDYHEKECMERQRFLELITKIPSSVGTSLGSKQFDRSPLVLQLASCAEDFLKRIGPFENDYKTKEAAHAENETLANEDLKCEAWLDAVKVALAKCTSDFNASTQLRQQSLKESVAKANAKTVAIRKAAADAAITADVVQAGADTSGVGITVSNVNAGTAVGATDKLVLKNKNIRFGNEQQPSFNAVTGLLEQPFYKNGEQWYRLTYGSNGLEDAMRYGGTGSGWNKEGWNNLPQMIGTPKILNSEFEERPKDAANGYKVGHGTLSSVTKYSCSNNITLTVTRMCTLGLMETSAEFTTHFAVSGGNLQNFRYWFGTRDDFVGSSDSPNKKIGYFDTKAKFTLASGAHSKRREWLCMSSGKESVYFGSMDDNVKVVQSGQHGSLDYVMNVDPETGSVDATDDGSYAVFAGFGAISAGQGRVIKAFYAVGSTQELGKVSKALAAKAEARKLELELEKKGVNLLWDYHEKECTERQKFLDSITKIPSTVSTSSSSSGMAQVRSKTVEKWRNAANVQAQNVKLAYTKGFLERKQTFETSYKVKEAADQAADETHILQLKKSQRAKEAESNSKKKAAKDLKSEKQALYLNQDNRGVENQRIILEFHAAEIPAKEVLASATGVQSSELTRNAKVAKRTKESYFNQDNQGAENRQNILQFHAVATAPVVHKTDVLEIFHDRTDKAIAMAVQDVADANEKVEGQNRVADEANKKRSIAQSDNVTNVELYEDAQAAVQDYDKGKKVADQAMKIANLKTSSSALDMITKFKTHVDKNFPKFGDEFTISGATGDPEQVQIVNGAYRRTAEQEQGRPVFVKMTEDGGTLTCVFSSHEAEDKWMIVDTTNGYFVHAVHSCTNAHTPFTETTDRIVISNGYKSIAKEPVFWKVLSKTSTGFDLKTQSTITAKTSFTPPASKPPPTIEEGLTPATGWTFSSKHDDYRVDEAGTTITKLKDATNTGVIADGPGCEAMESGEHYWELENVKHGNSNGFWCFGVCDKTEIDINDSTKSIWESPYTWMATQWTADNGWNTHCSTYRGTGCTDTTIKIPESSRVGLLLDLENENGGTLTIYLNKKGSGMKACGTIAEGLPKGMQLFPCVHVFSGNKKIKICGGLASPERAADEQKRQQAAVLQAVQEKERNSKMLAEWVSQDRIGKAAFLTLMAFADETRRLECNISNNALYMDKAKLQLKRGLDVNLNDLKEKEWNEADTPKEQAAFVANWTLDFQGQFPFERDTMIRAKADLANVEELMVIDLEHDGTLTEKDARKKYADRLSQAEKALRKKSTEIQRLIEKELSTKVSVAWEATVHRDELELDLDESKLEDAHSSRLEEQIPNLPSFTFLAIPIIQMIPTVIQWIAAAYALKHTYDLSCYGCAERDMYSTSQNEIEEFSESTAGVQKALSVLSLAATLSTFWSITCVDEEPIGAALKTLFKELKEDLGFAREPPDPPAPPPKITFDNDKEPEWDPSTGSFKQFFKIVLPMTSAYVAEFRIKRKQSRLLYTFDGKDPTFDPDTYEALAGPGDTLLDDVISNNDLIAYLPVTEWKRSKSGYVDMAGNPAAVDQKDGQVKCKVLLLVTNTQGKYIPSDVGKCDELPSMEWQRQGKQGDRNDKPTPTKVIIKTQRGSCGLITADNPESGSKITFTWGGRLASKDLWDVGTDVQKKGVYGTEVRSFGECVKSKKQTAFVPTDDATDLPGQSIYIYAVATSPGKMCSTYKLRKTKVNAGEAEAHMHAAAIELKSEENSIVQYSWNQAVDADNDAKIYKTGEPIPIRSFEKGVHQLHVKVLSRGLVPVESVTNYFVGELKGPSLPSLSDILTEEVAGTKAPLGGGTVARIRVECPDAILPTEAELKDKLDERFKSENRKSMKGVKFENAHRTNAAGSLSMVGDGAANRQNESRGELEGDNNDLELDDDLFDMGDDDDAVSVDMEVGMHENIANEAGHDDFGDLIIGFPETVLEEAPSGKQQSSGAKDFVGDGDGGALESDDDDDDLDFSSTPAKKIGLKEGIAAAAAAASNNKGADVAIFVDPDQIDIAASKVDDHVLIAAGEAGAANLFYFWSPASKKNEFEFDKDGKPIGDTFEVRSDGIVELDCSSTGKKSLHMKTVKAGFADSKVVVQSFEVQSLAEPTVQFNKEQGKVAIQPATIFEEGGGNDKAATAGRVLYSWMGPVTLGPGDVSEFKEWSRVDGLIEVPKYLCVKPGDQKLYLLSVQTGSVPKASTHEIVIDTAELPTFAPVLRAGCSTMLGITVGGMIVKNTIIRFAWSLEHASPFEWSTSTECNCTDPPSCKVESHCFTLKRNPDQRIIPISSLQGSSEAHEARSATLHVISERIGHAPHIFNQTFDIGSAEDLRPSFDETTGLILVKVPKDPETRIYFSFRTKISSPTQKGIEEFTHMYDGTASVGVASPIGVQYVKDVGEAVSISSLKVPMDLFSTKGVMEFNYLCDREGVNSVTDIYEFQIKPTPLPTIRFASDQAAVFIDSTGAANVTYYCAWKDGVLRGGSGGEKYTTSLSVNPEVLETAGEKQFYVKATQQGRAPSFKTFTITVKPAEMPTDAEVRYESDQAAVFIDTTAASFFCSWEDGVVRSESGGEKYEGSLPITAKVLETAGEKQFYVKAIQQGRAPSFKTFTITVESSPMPTNAEVRYECTAGTNGAIILDPNPDTVISNVSYFSSFFEDLKDGTTIGSKYNGVHLPLLPELLKLPGRKQLFLKSQQFGRAPNFKRYVYRVEQTDAIRVEQDDVTGAVTLIEPDGAAPDCKLVYAWTSISNTKSDIETDFSSFEYEDAASRTRILNGGLIPLPPECLEKPITADTVFPIFYFKYIAKGMAPFVGKYAVEVKSAVSDDAAFNAGIIRHDEHFTFTFLNADVKLDAADAKFYASLDEPLSQLQASDEVTRNFMRFDPVAGLEPLTVHWRVTAPNRAPSEGMQSWMQIPTVSLNRKGIVFTFPNTTLEHKMEKVVQIKYAYAVTGENYVGLMDAETWTLTQFMENEAFAELLPEGASESLNSVGDGWGVVPFEPSIASTQRSKSTAVLKLGQHGMATKAEMLAMGRTIRIWAACFTEDDANAISVVSAGYACELRSIPDGMRFGDLSQAFSHFEPDTDTGRRNTLSKVALSTHERDVAESVELEQRTKAAAWVKANDADGDGKIDLDEAMAFGMDEAMFHSLDTNADGSLSIKEIAKWLAHLGK